MSIKTKEKIDEDLQRLIDSPIVEPDEDMNDGPEIIEVRLDRVKEMSIREQERLKMVFKDRAVSPEVKAQDRAVGLGIFHNGDAELGFLALISAYGVDNPEFALEQLNGLLQTSCNSKDDLESLSKKATADIGMVAALKPEDAIDDEYDAAQERGEVYGLSRTSVGDDNAPANSADLGLCHDEIFEAWQKSKVDENRQ